MHDEILDKIKPLEILIEDFKRCERFSDYNEYLTRITHLLQEYNIYFDIIYRYLIDGDSDYESDPDE